MNHKLFLSWRGLIFLTLAILLPRMVSAQTNYYWQTIAQNVAVTAGTGPQGLGVDELGDIFFCATSDHTIEEATPVGTNWTIKTIAGLTGTFGTADGSNSVARFNNPFSLAVQNSSTLFVADSGNNAIRQVQLIGTNWVVATIAGICNPTGSGSQDGTNQIAKFTTPNGIALDRQGNLYIADTGNHIIRKIQPSGTNWITTTISGIAGAPGYIDATNLNAQFSAPYDVAVDASGKLFVADNGNDLIREIVLTGTNWVTTTIAGLVIDGGAGNPGFGDGTNTDSTYQNPASIAVDAFDNVYVADEFNNAIRKLSPAGGTNWLTLTIGGNGSNGGGGPPATDGTNVIATFTTPVGVAVDLAGNVYVGDTGDNALRAGYLFPPSLNFVLAGNQATLSYPANLGTNFGFVLQAATNLSNPVWLTVTNRWLLTTNATPFNVVGVTNKVPNRFFRLRLP